MSHVGIDLHKKESQVCILTDDGQIIDERVETRRDRLEAVLKPYPGARVLLEAATESEWVARHLEVCGHEVIVGDPNYAPMYVHRSPRIKTDRRDARALAEACRTGTYRAAHRRSQAQRAVQSQLMVRETLVRTRTRYISVVRAELRREGWRVRSGHAERFLPRVHELELPAATGALILPLLTMIDLLNEQIAQVSKALDPIAQGPVYDRLQTVPGVGPVTALAFVATLDQVARFQHARQVRAYLGLVPRERSSGEIQRRGRITKRGNARMRWLLVEAAWRVVRIRDPRLIQLKDWAARIAERRGKRIAMVALARRLAGILFALWRDGTEFTFTPRRAGSSVASV